MTPRCSGNKKYGYQTGNSLLFVRPLQSWQSTNIIAVQYNRSYANFFFLLQSLTSNPHHDSYLCFIGRNLDLRTSMLEDHALQWKHHSQISTVFMSFPKSRSVYRSTHGSRKTPFRLWYNAVSLKRQEFPSRLRFQCRSISLVTVVVL